MAKLPYEEVYTGPLSITEMQDAILALGWQFREHIYNDGRDGNCSIDASPSKSPHALTPGNWSDNKTVGWGRFERKNCWGMAYNYIVNGVRND